MIQLDCAFTFGFGICKKKIFVVFNLLASLDSNSFLAFLSRL